MSSGTAKRQRRKLHRQPDVPKRHDLAALKTARRAQAQLASATAEVMANQAIKGGLAGDLADCQAALKQARRRITDLAWLLAILSFGLLSAVVMVIVWAIMQ